MFSKIVKIISYSICSSFMLFLLTIGILILVFFPQIQTGIDSFQKILDDSFDSANSILDTANGTVDEINNNIVSLQNSLSKLKNLIVLLPNASDKINLQNQITMIETTISNSQGQIQDIQAQIINSGAESIIDNLQKFRTDAINPILNGFMKNKDLIAWILISIPSLFFILFFSSKFFSKRIKN